MIEEKYLYDPVELCRKLISFNTINGVNPEKGCMDFVKEMMEQAGMKTRVYFKDENRPNVLGVYESKAEKKLPPLMLYGHLDVVSVTGQNWTVDPFEGVLKDGYIWGRGAIDMKGQHAVMMTTLFQLIKDGAELPFDVYYLAVSDEEGASNYGMKFLVKEHPEIFEGVKYAFGEAGGFSMKLSGKKLYPIQIAEKQTVELKITAKGKGGHGSLKHYNTAMERMARAVTALSEKRLPVRITSAVRVMIEAMAECLGGAEKIALKLLLKPSLTDLVIDKAGDALSIFDPLLHNSINVTVIGGGDATNVIPAEVWCKCDLRMVPGCTVDEALAEIRSIIGNDFELELLDYTRGSARVDLTLFDGMAASIKEKDPQALPVPFVLTAVTDGRSLATLGIQSYGYTPMDFADYDYDFASMAHNENERVPASALSFGKETLYDYILNKYKEVYNE